MNKKVLIGIPVAVIVVILIGAVVINAGSLLDSENEIVIIEFDTAKAGQHVKELVQWGPRMTASEAEQNGAEYIAAQFEDAGLEEVHIETFQVPMFDVKRAQVSLVEYYPFKNIPRPLGQTIRFEHLTEFVMQGYSGSYNWGSFRGDLDVVNIGDGTDEGSYSRAKGRVCFVEQTGDTPPNAELYFTAYEAGVEAIILQNTWRGENLGYLPMFKTNQNPVGYQNYPDIPFFMVSKDMGNEILDRTSGSYKLRMNIQVEIGNMDCNVVVGDIVGSKNPDEYVLFTAHHDTCYNTIGAIDNTVGPASLIEMARGLSVHNPKRTIRFVTFSGEEEGLYGSKEYHAAHKGEFDGKLKIVMNFDMAHTDLEAMTVGMVTNDNGTLKQIENIGNELLDREPELSKYTINYSFDTLQIPYSDYWPFTNDGHKAVAAWGSGCEEYHTYLDNLDNLNPESMQIEGRILGSYALMAAS
ncbi:MAG: M28 family metallopeptidase [Candidatus Thermoplasmatota archaeon]|nr:M28 family metallopeptidase [Candidatus Thermoplasmatota archaeon]